MKKIKKQDKEDLPGYPHYPQSEDILNKEKPLDAEMEDISLSKDVTNKNLKPLKKEANPIKAKPGKSDLTKDDLTALGPIDRNMDGGDDELLDALEIGPDFSGDDLDVPGSELDDESEDIGSEDEENNYYSRGQE